MKTDAERQRDHRSRMRRFGFKLVQLWVHKSHEPELREVARELRDGHPDYARVRDIVEHESKQRGEDLRNENRQKKTPSYLP